MRRAAWLLTFALTGVAHAAPAEMRDAKSHAITITANVPDAAVLEDGLFLGQAGATFDAVPGVHELTVTRQGYVPRLIVVPVGDNDKAVTRSVTLLPTPTKNDDVELDFKQVKSFPAVGDVGRQPSLCQRFNASGARLPRNLYLPCTRATALDDLQAFGLETLFDTAHAGPDVQRSGLLTQLSNAHTDGFFWSAEALYGVAPADPAAAGLLAYSAVRHGSCARVMAIAMELSAAKIQAPVVMFARGACIEMSGKPDKAVALYQLAGERGLGATAYYQAARAAAATSPQAAMAAAQRCVVALPQSYLCTEGMAQTLALGGDVKKATNILNLYRQQTVKDLVALFPRGRAPSAPAVEAMYAQRPQCYELAVAHAALNPNETLDANSIARMESLLMASPSTVMLVLPLVDQAGKLPLMASVYIRVADARPKDVNLRIRASEMLAHDGRCDDAVKGYDKALRLLPSGARRSSVIVAKSACLIKSGDFGDAEAALLPVVQEDPENWRARYNLGVAQERQGKTDAAIANLEYALGSDIPDSMHASIEKMLEYHRKGHAKGDPSALPASSPKPSE